MSKINIQVRSRCVCVPGIRKEKGRQKKDGNEIKSKDDVFCLHRLPPLTKKKGSFRALIQSILKTCHFFLTRVPEPLLDLPLEAVPREPEEPVLLTVEPRELELPRLTTRRVPDLTVPFRICPLVMRDLP